MFGSQITVQWTRHDPTSTDLIPFNFDSLNLIEKISTRRNEKSSNHQLSHVFVLVVSSQQKFLEA